jgi:hypothetical protein
VRKTVGLFGVWEIEVGVADFTLLIFRENACQFWKQDGDGENIVVKDTEGPHPVDVALSASVHVVVLLEESVVMCVFPRVPYTVLAFSRACRRY